MANLHDCLEAAIQAGGISLGRGRAAQSEFDQLVYRYIQAMPRHQAEATAAAHLKEATSRAARSRRHAVLNQLQSMVRLQHLINTSDNPAQALRNLLEWSPDSTFKGESVQSLSRAIITSVDHGINDFLKATHRNLIGNSRDKALMDAVIRELHGDATGNAAAAALAQAVRKQQKRLRQMFNAHGGDIGDLADFGATHSHDAARLRKMGFEPWRDSVAVRLDWSRIPDHNTGQPFVAQKGDVPSPAARDRFLKDVYDGIVTGGWDTRQPSMSMGGKALYNRRAEARVLHFKSGADWLAYNKEFGLNDPFSAVIGGLHGLARDVAQMRVLGPNPRMGLEYATQVAKVRAAKVGDHKLAERVAKQGAKARTMLNHFDGSVNNTEWQAASAFFSGARQVLTSVQLGSAALSAVTDAATITVASQAMGMKATNVLSRSVQLMTSNATRETAARMGFVADTLSQAGNGAARFLGETIGPELTGRLTDFTMRASGLSFWTDMNRTAFKMEFAGFLAENASRALNDVDPLLRDLLQKRGITATDWDNLRAPAGMFTAPNGATFLSPMHWLEHQTSLPRMEAEGLAMRLQMAIEEQLEMAVPTVTLEGRAGILGNTQPGTFGGESLRSTVMYKSFAISLTLNQVRRFNALPTKGAKAIYAAKMSVGMFTLGALAVQLKEMSKGRDPRPMNTGKFAMAALFQGGGLGIFGDFFSSETSRAGGGLAETMGGPVVGLASDTLFPVATNLTALATGKDTHLGRDLSNLIRYNTPVLSSLWPTRLAFDRIVADQLQLFLDPDAESAWRRQERQREREYGSATIWPRGAPLPERFPDPTNALGN